jgi:hypothetical protein
VYSGPTLCCVCRRIAPPPPLAGLHRQVVYGGLRIGLYEPVRRRREGGGVSSSMLMCVCVCAGGVGLAVGLAVGHGRQDGH